MSSSIRVSLRRVYNIEPGCKALYKLIDRHNPEQFHIKLLEVQNTLGHLYIDTLNPELLQQIEFIKELDQAAMKCRIS